MLKDWEFLLPLRKMLQEKDEETYFWVLIKACDKENTKVTSMH